MIITNRWSSQQSHYDDDHDNHRFLIILPPTSLTPPSASPTASKDPACRQNVARKRRVVWFWIEYMSIQAPHLLFLGREPPAQESTWLEAHAVGDIMLAHAPKVLQERVAQEVEKVKVEMAAGGLGRQRLVSQRWTSKSVVEAARWIPSSDQSRPATSSPWTVGMVNRNMMAGVMMVMMRKTWWWR